MCFVKGAASQSCSQHNPSSNKTPRFSKALAPAPPPHLDPNTNLWTSTYLISRVFVKQTDYLSEAHSNWLHRFSFSGCWCQAADQRCHNTRSASRRPAGLLLGSPAIVAPIKCGSLAIFTQPALRVIELVQQCTSLLMVKWVFLRPLDPHPRLLYRPSVWTDIIFFFLLFSCRLWGVTGNYV